MKPIIEVKGLRFSYGEEEVLRGIDLEVYEGEVLVVLGPNGAGKSTLLKCILGLLNPVKSVYINGKAISELSLRLRSRVMAYVPQSHHTPFPLKIIDLVLLGRTPHLNPLSTPGKSDYEKALKALEELGIAHLAERRVTEVSGGQLQLALIARALAQEAQVLILDEPEAHLDIVNRALVLNALRKLVRNGRVKAVIMSLHDPQLAAYYADRIVLLSRGSIIAIGRPEEVLTPENLKVAYGVGFWVHKAGGRLFVVPLLSE